MVGRSNLARAALLASLSPVVRPDDSQYFGLYDGAAGTLSDPSLHSSYASLDADLAAIDAAALSSGSLSAGPPGQEGLDTAYGIYTSGLSAATEGGGGGEADEGDGTNTVWQLATREHIDLGGATTAGFFADYYGTDEWADRWLEAAYRGERADSLADGAADFSAWSYVPYGQGTEARGSAFGYGALVLVFWPHVVGSFEVAYDKCGGEPGANSASLEWWDGAVSLYGGAEVMESRSEGNLLYALANDVARSFGVESVNDGLFAKFRDGRQALVEGDCDAARTDLEAIISLMLVPLIQGSLRAMHAVDGAGGNAITDGGEGGRGVSGAASLGQAAAFGAVMLPMVADCSKGNAAAIYRDMVPGGGPGDGSYEVVKAALERCYRRFAVKCDWVGGLDGSGPCDDAEVARAPPAPLTYEPSADVTRWARLDESVREMRSKLTRKDQTGLDGAYAAYTTWEGGGGAGLGDAYTAWRLAERAHIQLDGSFTEKLFNGYYGADTWTDDWVEAAYLGRETTAFARSRIDFSASKWNIEKRSSEFLSRAGIYTSCIYCPPF